MEGIRELDVISEGQPLFEVKEGIYV